MPFVRASFVVGWEELAFHTEPIYSPEARTPWWYWIFGLSCRSTGRPLLLPWWFPAGLPWYGGFIRFPSPLSKIERTLDPYCQHAVRRVHWWAVLGAAVDGEKTTDLRGIAEPRKDEWRRSYRPGKQSYDFGGRTRQGRSEGVPL